MWRTVLGVVGGLAAWVVIVTLLNIGLRHALPDYAAAEPVLAFTLTMMVARLPLWYHLFFLITLAPLVVLGAQLRLGKARG